MDLTATTAVFGLTVVALIAVTRRNQLLLALTAVGAGALWTAEAPSVPTDAWSLLARLAAAILLLDLGARLRPPLPRGLHSRPLVVAVLLAVVAVAVATPFAGVYPSATVALLVLAALARTTAGREPILVAMPLALAGSLVPLTAALPSEVQRFGLPIADLLLLPVIAGLPAGLLLRRVLRTPRGDDRGLLLAAALVLPVTLASLAGATGVATSLAIGATVAYGGDGPALRRVLAPLRDLALLGALTVAGAAAASSGQLVSALPLGVALGAAAGWRGRGHLPGAIVAAGTSVATWLVVVGRFEGGARVATAVVMAAVLTPLVGVIARRISTPERDRPVALVPSS